MAFCMTVLAGVIQATGDAAQAARLFGAAKKLLQSLNAAIDPRAAHSNTTATSPTRARLGEEAIANAWQEGRMLTLEQAVDEAMSKGS
jgi:hypothetical protein